MKSLSLRNAFSMLTAIIVIILMSTVALLIMSLSGKMVKETTEQYQREQAELYAKSYTEYAIMAVTANDRNTTGAGQCLTDINGTIGTPTNGEGYSIGAHIAYIGQNAQVGSCDANSIFSNTVIAPKSPLSIIVDVYVKYKDIDHPDIANAPWITYHKRTLQKI